MPSKAEITEQVASESRRRDLLSRPAFAGGVLYLLGGIIIASTLNGAPRVGLFQGLAPALAGEAGPAVSPRAAEVKFISHHAFALIAGGTITAIAFAALLLTLLLLLDAARFRRPQTWSAARPLVLFGGAALVVVSVGHQVVTAIETHNFATGHDLSSRAVDRALPPVRGGGQAQSTANVIVDYLGLLVSLAFATGMIAVIINARRVGLITRWMGVFGIVAAVLIFYPFGGPTLEVVPAFWLVAMGVLYAGKWPNGDPPAWAAGEARPWPSQAELRAARQAGKPGKGQPALAGVGSDVAPAPSQPKSGGASRKRRKRGSR